jgi:hypothetical protein
VIDTLDTLKSLDTLDPLDTLASRGSRVSTVSRINRIKRSTGELIREGVDVRPLALAVISQALREVRGQNTLKALDAALWISGNDAPWWFEAVGIPFADGLHLLTTWRGRGRLGKK